ncbi:acyltransferase [Nocardioides sp.]|uniref:acyltransferase n=1 Tax=Nocardioides sp. TaxID=35761 RepID=UPI001A311669|nr:acyltransferase [Nocardioides sp.]MBJ7359418.1 acyltransferase [Nocardioides sp.]
MNPVGRLLNRGVHAARLWVARAGEIVPGTHAADRFGSFGEGTCIDYPPATLLNVEAIHLGSGTLVGRHATLSVGYGVGDLHLAGRGLFIGDRCVLGARTTITAHERIEIGDAVFFGQGVFVTDASHGYQDPGLPIGKQLGAHQPVSIGSGTWVGHGAVILPGARLGRNVVVAAGAVVRGVIEDFAVVAGSPARVVRRLEPGVGWVGSSDVRPVVDQSQLFADG